MSRANVPIAPEELKEIAATVAREVDPDIRRSVERSLLRLAQKWANEEALDRSRFRNAVEEARLNGYGDPEAFARARVGKLNAGDLFERRVRASFKRGEARLIKHRDRLANRYEKASKSAKPSLRRLPQRDRQYVQIVGDAEKDGTLSKRALVLLNLERKIPRYRLPHWEKTTPFLKVLSMSVMSAIEGALTINLHLNPKVCEEALRSPRGPVPYMQDRIRRELGNTFGKGKVPDFWIVIEVDTPTRFHLHGAVVTPNMPDAVEMVDDALRAAGGSWVGRGGHYRQQLPKPLAMPIGWASYVCKRMNKTKTQVTGKLFASTLPIRSRAAAGWDDLRASLPQSPRTS